jgi:hypothetical protein
MSAPKQKLTSLPNLTCSIEDSEVFVDTVGSVDSFESLSIQDGVKKEIRKQIEFWIKLNNASLEEQKKHIMSKPEDIVIIINPHEDLVAISKFKKL